VNLKNLFNPKSIAVVGASEEKGKVGNVIAKNLLEMGYAGEVFLVNPKHETLFGKKCYGNLQKIETEIDLAIIAIPAKFVNKIVDEAKAAVKNYIIISAGFAETSEEGKVREEKLAKMTQEHNLNILGPNCLGFIVPSLNLNASFAGGMPEMGNIALVSQSGALAVAMMDAAKNNGLKFSSVISIGNKMQIGETEMLEYLDKDEKTKIIGMYLEGIKDGKKFMEIAEKISKPIVILKAGKTEKSQKSITSHTGALAGDDAIMSEVFKELGIIRAENIDDFLSNLNLISNIKKPKNEKVIVITNAGGLGVLATDAFKDKKIALADIGEKSKEKLRNFLSEESSLENPIDLLGDADESRYSKALKVAGREEADTIICLLTPQDQTPVNKIAGKIINFRKKTDKKIIAVFMGGERVKKAAGKMEENSIPVFFLVDQAINALDKYCQSFGNEVSKREIAANDGELNKDIFNKARQEGRKVLCYQEARELLKEYEIEVLETYDAKNSDILYPVAVKIDSEKFLHKTDQGALKLNIQNNEELEKAVREMEKNFSEKKIIIQPMAPKGTELIVGMKRDVNFGPIITFGLGGIYTEVFHMIDLMLPNSDKEAIKKRILESQIEFLFSGARHQTPYNLEELAKIIANISEMSLKNSEISEMDINPLIIYNNGQKAQVVDVKIII
jgi:acetate---CoA ligase (ADP-forming)